jgi:hypothetical protein
VRPSLPPTFPSVTGASKADDNSGSGELSQAATPARSSLCFDGQNPGDATYHGDAGNPGKRQRADLQPHHQPPSTSIIWA